MFPQHRRFMRVCLTPLSIALIAFATQFTPRAFAIPGDLYVTDLTAGSINVFAIDGTQTTFATGLSEPQGILVLPGGMVFVSDSGTGSILQYAPDGTQTVFATGLVNPMGLTLDGSYILVAENGADMVTRIAPDGTKTLFQSVVAPVGVTFQNGSAYITHGTSVLKVASDMSTTEFDLGVTARDVAVVTKLVGGVLEDTVFVSTDADTIQEIAADGTIMQFAPGGTLSDPKGLAFRPARFSGDTDGVGNLYVGETTPGDIVEFTKTAVESIFATFGNPNFLSFEPGILPPPSKALNISTRTDVQTGENVAIGGFIITGTDSKLVVIRGIGPSLTDAGVPGALADPILELHDSTGATIATNDNWMDNTPEDQMTLTDHLLAPTDDLESAIVMNLDPGSYTAVLAGVDGATGVALFEAYDLDDSSVTGELGNLSTRGLVGTEASVMIGGLIVGPTDGADASFVLRAIGPSLADNDPPVENPLIDPVLEVHNENGDLLAMNDDWETDPAPNNYSAEVSAAGLAPTDQAESAVFLTLSPGLYTAIMSGKDATVGVGLVEVYHVAAPEAR